MAKVVTLGEIMLRLSPPGYERFAQASRFDVNYGGAEANVAASLAQLGNNAAFLSKIPKNAIGDAAIATLKSLGVNCQYIARGGKRLGIYFLEKKTSQRPSNVIYNRSGSAIALAEESDFDWDAIFEDATWFHFSGITPAISDTLAKVCLTACKKAKEKGMTVSCDLNYRSKLWSGEKANKVMTEICQYVDICIANEDDAIGIFQLEPVGEGTEKNEYIAKELMKRFPFKMVAAVWRTETSITTFKLQSMIYTDGKAYYSKEYFMHILDYIGAGDAFCAGLIYACLQKYDAQKMVEFANAASCLKHTVSGDFNLVTADEVSQLAFSESGNEVQR